MKLILFPFYLIWSLISFIFKLTGRVLGIIVGLVLIIVGLILTFTVIGAIVGIPLCILGVLLVIRSIFK
jgi:hypothetical protein